MVIACLRIYALHTVSYMDITYTAAYPVLWSFTEPAIGVSVASAPLLRPLFKGTKLGFMFKTKNSRPSGKPSASSSSFHRLDEDHALSDLERGPNSVTISAGKRQRRGSLSAESWESLAHDTSGITVKHELRMQRE